MAQRTNTMGGGIFVALCPLIGVLVGRQYGEPSLGLVIGLGVGAALAIAVWAMQR